MRKNICKLCGTEKVVNKARKTKTGYIYQDDSGRQWHGAVCPNCKLIRFRKPKIAKTCPTCKSSFKAAHPHYKYCSKKCSSYQLLNTTIQFECVYCSTVRSVKKGMGPIPKYCSKRCKYKVNEAKRKANCPHWVDGFKLAIIYKNCPRGWHVDHIIPINGENVSGLHVPWNLQYLPKEINEFKSNKFDGTYNNEGWKATCPAEPQDHLI